MYGKVWKKTNHIIGVVRIKAVLGIVVQEMSDITHINVCILPNSRGEERKVTVGAKHATKLPQHKSITKQSLLKMNK